MVTKKIFVQRSFDAIYLCICLVHFIWIIANDVKLSVSLKVFFSRLKMHFILLVKLSKPSN